MPNPTTKIKPYLQHPEIKTIAEVFCTHFGCGKKLSLIESLAGNKCTTHSGVGRVDVMKVLKFK